MARRAPPECCGQRRPPFLWRSPASWRATLRSSYGAKCLEPGAQSGGGRAGVLQNTRVETFTHSLLPERVLTSRSKSGVSNFCAAHCWTLQSPIQTCVLRRDRLELHSTPAEEYPNSRSAAWFHGLPQIRRPPSSAGMRTVPPPASRPSRLSIEGFNSIMRQCAGAFR